MRRTGSVSISPPRLLPLLLLLAAPACATGPAATPQPDPDPAVAEIEATLRASAEAWTAGDLDGYLEPYAEDASFAGGAGVVRGIDEIRHAYTSGYWASGRPQDALRFRFLEVRRTGTRSALAVGRYFLEDRQTGIATSSGFFSLVLERREGAWKIVHDHSSAEQQ